MKVNSKKKRSREEMEAVREEEKMIKENRQQFLTEFKRMKQCEAMGNEEME